MPTATANHLSPAKLGNYLLHYRKKTNMQTKIAIAERITHNNEVTHEKH